VIFSLGGKHSPPPGAAVSAIIRHATLRGIVSRAAGVRGVIADAVVHLSRQRRTAIPAAERCSFASRTRNVP
jgi:hypothetical protein